MNTLILRNAAKVASRRTFSVSALARKDLIQDMYLKEIKAYKPSAPKETFSQGFTVPSAPSAPAVPSSNELASQLSAYDAVVPSVADKVATTSEGGKKVESQSAESFLEDLRADEVEVAHH